MIHKSLILKLCASIKCNVLVCILQIFKGVSPVVGRIYILSNKIFSSRNSTLKKVVLKDTDLR